MSRPGIKPVSKLGGGGGSNAGPAPRPSRRAAAAAGGAGLSIAGVAPKGSRALSKGKDSRSQPALPVKEQAISAAHLLSLLGPVGGHELRQLGMFSAADERSQPVSNPKIHEFQPLDERKPGRRGAQPPVERDNHSSISSSSSSIRAEDGIQTSSKINTERRILNPVTRLPSRTISRCHSLILYL
jgi:hypothetical protein